MAILSCGGYLPSRIVTNRDLEATLQTTDAWIRERTGIAQRHVADVTQGETTSYLAFQAAKEALGRAEISPESIDIIIVATTTPDRVFPSVGVKVQSFLGAKNAFAFDIQAVCSGFLYALSTADAFLRSGSYRRALIIGAETMSTIMDWGDRSTAVLFGDGAGALILDRDDWGGTGILGMNLSSQGDGDCHLYAEHVTASLHRGKIFMNGREIFKQAVYRMEESILSLLSQHHLETHDIDWLIPHQANQRILNALSERLSIPKDKMISTVDRHANTSAASIPLALSEAFEKISRGEKIMLTAFGSGLTWGSILMER